VTSVLRWMSREEFEAGERTNPYPDDTPAALRPMRAVPERSIPWLLAPGPGLIGPIARRLRADRGQVWLPDAAFIRRFRCRSAVLWLCMLDVCVGLLAAGGENGVALLAFLVITLVALPIAVRALRRTRVFAVIDHRTRLVGVEDGQAPSREYPST
jgi:hypothetical protein